MSDILQEVDEALKQDKMAKIWKNYGPYIIAALVMIVLVTAAKSGYEHYHRTTSERATTSLISILNNEDTDKSAALADFIKTAKGGSALIAQLQLAGEQLNAESPETALETFNAISENSKAPDYFRDFAELMNIQIKMDSLSDDNLAEIKAELDALIAKEKSSWRHHALLNRAVLSAAQQDYKSAISDTGRVKSAPNLPETLTKRARALEQLYTIKLAKSDS